MPVRWITFDCFGTLVDWNTGFAAALTPIFGARTPEVVYAYHEFERALESGPAHLSYREVLTRGLTQAAAKTGLALSLEQARTLPQWWATLPVFPDVEEMLAGLRARGCRLAVLTNCDDDLFALTQRNFCQPFDLVVTAQQVRSYKPALPHFQRFQEITGTTAADWIHVACSWYHDIAPTQALGIPRFWLDRDHTGEDPRTATAHLQTAAEACPALDRLRSV